MVCALLRNDRSTSRAGTSSCTTHPITGPLQAADAPAGRGRRGEADHPDGREVRGRGTSGTPRRSYAAKSAKLDEACATIGRDPAQIRRATGRAVRPGDRPGRGGGSLPRRVRRVRGLRLWDRPVLTRPCRTCCAALGLTGSNLDSPSCLSLTVVVDGLVMRDGVTTAVDDLSLTVARGFDHRGPRAERRRQDHNVGDLRGLSRAAAGLGAGPRPGPATSGAASCPPDRRDAPGRRRVERRPGAGRCCATSPRCTRTRSTRRCSRSGSARRVRPDAVPPALGRPEAAARPGDGAGRAARGGLRRRADRGAGPGRAGVRLGAVRGAARATA